ncbi:MAG: ATP-binding protein [Prevotella sp.]|nr:ATP-binding protein [Prevotella sp.]
MQNLLELKPTMDDIERLQPFVAQTAEKAGIVGREAKRLRLAVEEAVANVINYGQATVITLRAATDAGRLVLTIDDDGQPFDPTQDSPTDLTVPADERPPGGLGIILLHQMTDRLSYQRLDGHNVLRIEKMA